MWRYHWPPSLMWSSSNFRMSHEVVTLYLWTCYISVTNWILQCFDKLLGRERKNKKFKLPPQCQSVSELRRVLECERTPPFSWVSKYFRIVKLFKIIDWIVEHFKLFGHVCWTYQPFLSITSIILSLVAAFWFFTKLHHCLYNRKQLNKNATITRWRKKFKHTNHVTDQLSI